MVEIAHWSWYLTKIMSLQNHTNPYFKNYSKSAKAQSKKPKSLIEIQKPNTSPLTPKNEYKITSCTLQVVL